MKTNSLFYTTSRVAKDGTQFKIDIRLNDCCKNGHQDFSITGKMWEANKPKTEHYSLVSGAIGDEIAKQFPEFKIFNDLHLCDYSGAPMYAIDNGMFHMKRSPKEVAMNYLRITDVEYKALAGIRDKHHFAYVLFQLGVVSRWRNEANEAIKQLEALTGNEFLNDSVRSQIGVEDIAMKDVEEKIKTGYYSPVNMKKRDLEVIKSTKTEAIDKIKKQVEKDINKLLIEADIKLIVIECGFMNTNFIYYSHSNELRFNWLDYKDKFSEKEIKKIQKSLVERGFKLSIKTK